MLANGIALADRRGGCRRLRADSGIAYWDLVYRHLKRLVRGRITQDGPGEQPTFAP